MNRLDAEKRAQVISALVEGCSIRSIVRMTGVNKKTVMRLLNEIGTVCAKYQDRAFRNLSSGRIEVDELWAYIYCKNKNLTPENQARGAVGDIWLWVAICADSKLVPSWHPGQRGCG